MIRALLKKQLMEVFTWLYQDKKIGAKRSGKRYVLYLLLYGFVFFYLSILFFGMSLSLCTPLVQAGLGWFYWCIMGILGLVMGVFGSVFSTYSSLYRAKDNDLLLSMPIPPLYVLLTRLSGVYVTGLLYTLVVLLPTCIVWVWKTPFSLAGVLFALLFPILVSLLVLDLSAILGWVVAVVASHVRHKTAITVLASVAFLVLYFWGYSKLYPHMMDLVENLVTLGATFQHTADPLYWLGRAGAGHVPSMLLCVAVVLLLTAGVFWVLHHNFLTMATAQGSVHTSGKTQKMEKQKAHSVSVALLHRELRRFTSNANYMMNCGLGTLFLPLAAVAVIWKRSILLETLDGMGLSHYGVLLAAVVLGMAISMNDMTACSLSLEGDTLWLLQSLPVSGCQVLSAKIQLQLWLTLPPAVLVTLALTFAMSWSPLACVLLLVFVGLYSFCIATLGLTLNLLFPNLHWTDEIVVIKQGLPIMGTLLGSWVILGILAVIYLILHLLISPLAYLGIVCGLLLLCCVLLFRWIMTSGAERFEKLL